jgi:hypothetical protein
MSQAAHDIAVEGLKATPAVAVTSSMLAGVDMAAWVPPLTAVFLLMQIGWLAWKYWEKIRAVRRGEAHDFDS